MSFLTSTKSNHVLLNIALLLVRVFAGFAMISHGFPKLQQLMSGSEIQFVSLFGMGAKTSLIMAVFAEFVCSIFLILGLFSRVALVFLMGTMAIAGLYIHASDPFAKQELSLLYLSVFVLLFACGPGKYSVDAMIGKRRQSGY